MDIKSYLSPLFKWWWLLVAATFIAAAASFVVTIGQPPIYQSRTTLMIGQSISNPNPSSNQFFVEQQLAEIYADMATRETIRKDTMDSLGLTWLPDYTSQTIPETQFIEITVTDTNPVRAQAVAAELANQLIKRTPTNAQSEEVERQTFINEQLSLLQNDITATQDEIDQLKIQLGNLNSAFEISETEREIAGLEAKLTTLQDNYSRLLSGTEKGALNTLNIIEPAEVPNRPIGPNKMLTILISAAVGLFLAAGGSYLIEWIDQTIRTAEEATHLVKSPMFVEIPKFPPEEDAATYVNRQPFSPITDSFRTLRTNIEFLGLGEELKTILITSPGVGEGKTTISVNLAVSIAKMKKKVILVDADFHQSEMNARLGLPQTKGLGDLYKNGQDIDEYLIPIFNGLLQLLPVGTIPANPSELLSSPQTVKILERLREMADVIIIDGPPFIVSDSLVLSAKANGVLLVLRSGRSRRDVLNNTIIQMNRASANILGFVMNASAPKPAYYNYYYPTGQNGNSNGNLLKFKLPKREKNPSGSKEEPKIIDNRN